MSVLSLAGRTTLGKSLSSVSLRVFSFFLSFSYAWCYESSHYLQRFF